MLDLAHILLRLLHRLYFLIITLHSYWKRLFWKAPAPLDAPRRRVPRHLALLISGNNQSSDEVIENLIECVTRAVGWCRIVGVRKLTVYDEHGVLVHCAPRIEKCIDDEWSEPDSSASEIEYPLTPPSSDYADSRPISPASNLSRLVTLEIPRRAKKSRSHLNVKKRRSHRDATKPLTLCIISRDSAKPALARAAFSFLRPTDHGTRFPQITVNCLDTLLEYDNSLSSPDFLIVHSINPQDHETPLELHGYPPWHIRLTEIHYRNRLKISDSPCLVDEIMFREALDEYAQAEFRLGK